MNVVWARLETQGYRLVERGRRRFLVLEGFEGTDLVLALPLRAGEAMPGEDPRPLPGRRLAVSVRLRVGGEDGRFVVRRLAHGGRLAPLTGEVFCGRSPRPFREVEASLVARRAGVATPEIVVAGVARVAALFYTGTVVTREIEGAVNLWDALPGTGADRVRAILRAAGAAVRRLHDAGILHADLNLKNLLVTWEDGKAGAMAGAGPLVVHILDLDKARTGPAPTQAERLSNLRRLLRSARRLDPAEAVVDGAAISALVEGYGARLARARPLEIRL